MPSFHSQDLPWNAYFQAPPPTLKSTARSTHETNPFKVLHGFQAFFVSAPVFILILPFSRPSGTLLWYEVIQSPFRVGLENRRKTKQWSSAARKSEKVKSVFKFLTAVGGTVSQLFA